jgi:hypothetical protein
VKGALHAAALVVQLCLAAGHVRAHAPLARGLALAPNAGDGIALRMPGFGWVLGHVGTDGEPASFAYACDALVGAGPLDEELPMAFRGDGVLLVGTHDGVRMLSPSGCPLSARALEGRQVSQLVAQPMDADRLYAVAASVDGAPHLWRSDNGGDDWMQGAELPWLPVTSLVPDADEPDLLFVSQRMPGGGSRLTVSHDSGSTLESFEHGRELTLVHAQSAARRLWAFAPLPDQPVGVSILRSASPGGPFEERWQVNFFGGLAVDSQDPLVVWLGDESGGLFRSDDGGEHFEDLETELPTACLGERSGTLWACIPGLPEQVALARRSGGVDTHTDVLALSDVQRMVECGPEVDVPRLCGAAWAEWQRDVLGAIDVSPSHVQAMSDEPEPIAMPGTVASSMSEAGAQALGANGEPAMAPVRAGCAVSALHESSSASHAVMLALPYSIALSLRRRARSSRRVSRRVIASLVVSDAERSRADGSCQGGRP